METKYVQNIGRFKKIVLLNIILVAGLCFILSNCNDSKVSMAAIKGMVNDTDGNPLSNVKIGIMYHSQGIQASPTHIIEYQVPESQHVKVWIQDTDGDRLVRELINETQNSGIYGIVWDLKNEENKLVPSSFYNVVIELHSGIEVFMIFVNPPDYTEYSFNEVIEITRSDEDGRFEIYQEDLIHHSPHLNDFRNSASGTSFNPGNRITLWGIDSDLGVVANDQVFYDTMKSEAVRADLSY